MTWRGKRFLNCNGRDARGKIKGGNHARKPKEVVLLSNSFLDYYDKRLKTSNSTSGKMLMAASSNENVVETEPHLSLKNAVSKKYHWKNFLNAVASMANFLKRMKQEQTSTKETTEM